ncbi:MAG: carbamoyl-phosphate synthase large subunit, partial [Planctomycetia bacterium]
GSNIQYAINPADGRMVAIEMNPRVSRSSALASKATGFPIAKIAAKLAVGYRLDELKNDITRETPACFEPTLDYVVVKIPRFTFEKFPEANTTLTTQMKSIGEVMAIGRTFKESLQKALRSMETGQFGLGCNRNDPWENPSLRPTRDQIVNQLVTPTPQRIWAVRHAFLAGMSVEEVHDRCYIDPWFLQQMKDLVDFETRLRSVPSVDAAPVELIRQAKQWGFSDRQLCHLWGGSELEFRRHRKALGVAATFRLVDTCAAEFEAYTPYYYSTYDTLDEASVDPAKRRIVILGGGPNRIGQGIEFDYCCCHAAFALSEMGFETVMVNSNPETVSTDYDTSDRLFFEPLTVEDVLNVCDRVEPWGVIVQFGGQTPLNLARALAEAGVPIIGTSPENIHAAEDRDRFQKVLTKLNLRQPNNGIANDFTKARTVAAQVGYPILVRPSFVLGGRAMEIVYDESTLQSCIQRAMEAAPDQPILIDQFLEDATEVDVDALADGRRCLAMGVMEHIEEAGIHSGDSACALPPYSLKPAIVAEIKQATYALARELNVVGLMNIQFAVKNDVLYVLEVNPRASRSAPFVSKATGFPLARLAAQIMAGETLDSLNLFTEPAPAHVSVKESTFPFSRFPGVDIILGPEMRSTGEVMGIDTTFPMAFAKSQAAASNRLPTSGRIFVSLADRDKQSLVDLGTQLVELGYEILATSGTARLLADAGCKVTRVHKLQQGRPNIIDFMKNDEVSLIINTPSGQGARTDEGRIRAEAVARGVPCITTVAGAFAAVQAIRALKAGPLGVVALQDWLKSP